MQLFAPDLYRSFAIGFGASALALVAITLHQNNSISADLASPARAATPLEQVDPHGDVSSEFLIVDFAETAE